MEACFDMIEPDILMIKDWIKETSDWDCINDPLDALIANGTDLQVRLDYRSTMMYVRYQENWILVLKNTEDAAQEGVRENEFFEKVDNGIYRTSSQLDSAIKKLHDWHNFLKYKQSEILSKTKAETVDTPNMSEYSTLLDNQTRDLIKQWKFDVQKVLFAVIHEMTRLKSILSHKNNKSIQKSLSSTDDKRFSSSMY